MRIQLDGWVACTAAKAEARWPGAPVTPNCLCKQDYAAAFQRASELGMTLPRPQTASAAQDTISVVAQVGYAVSCCTRHVLTC